MFYLTSKFHDNRVNTLGFMEGGLLKTPPAQCQYNVTNTSICLKVNYLKFDVSKYQNSRTRRQVVDCFIFCPSKPYGKLFSKNALKGSAALWFCQNRGIVTRIQTPTKVIEELKNIILSCNSLVSNLLIC